MSQSENDQQPGQSDWVRPGGARPRGDRPDEAGDDASGGALSPSPEVHGDEGGGDLNAGAEEDSVARGPDGGHRSPPQV